MVTVKDKKTGKVVEAEAVDAKEMIASGAYEAVKAEEDSEKTPKKKSSKKSA